MNEIIHDDWHVFSNMIKIDKQLLLLSELTDSDNVFVKKFQSSLSLNKAKIDKWNLFIIELKHENRFFPKKVIDREQLSELFDFLVIDKNYNPKFIYRARINPDSQPFPLPEMGKPPREMAKDGRANPKGIPYLYAASDYKTAIAEARPYKSEYVSVAKIKVKKKISLIDLRDPKSSISPFGLDDDNVVLLYTEDMPFLCHLSDSLSKPIHPNKKELEYLPTQYLCEFIKDKNFNGIVFKSSLEKGDNYVIFDDTFISRVKVDNYFISDTLVKPKKYIQK
ncbi:RES family NAD+ phosphorylase [bacterium]|nr:RES family NAD+ phosphorylase [bacterium]MBU1063981.1 RES family NAD+ phosphorylase [bacterium]MBU1634728.1 RES family NAD+ phosphorylase [bacterium]MBU1874434.1 RES family NAD+ phosphorylase [bacterium]